MAVKGLTVEQCQYLHQHFPPPDCCICNARAESEALRQECDKLRRKNADLHRRAQLAEGVANDNVEKCRRAGVSLGRGLALYESSRLREELEQVKKELEEKASTRPLRDRHDGDCEIYDSFARICTCGFHHEQLPITEGRIYPEKDLEKDGESRRVLSRYYEEKERIADPLGLSPTIIQRSREQHAAGETVSLQDFLASLASAEVVREAELEVEADAREIATYDPDTTNEAQPDWDELVERLQGSIKKLDTARGWAVFKEEGPQSQPPGGKDGT